MAGTIFVTGPDTGVGKTVLTALLLRHLRQTGRQALAMKPFAAGSRHDAELLDRVQQGGLPSRLLNPYFFRRALAPFVAARACRRTITAAAVIACISEAQRRCDALLVEGCGGLLTPLGERFTLLDLIGHSPCAIITVAPDRLGVLGQVMLTLHALPQAARLATAVVLMGCRKPDGSTRMNTAALRELAAPIPVWRIPFLGRLPCARESLDRHVRRLRKVLVPLTRFTEFCHLAARQPAVAGSQSKKK